MSKGFCALPFVQYSTYNGGRYRLCCMAKEPKETVNQEELGIKGTWNHDYIKDVRARMAEGEWLPECSECERLERNDIMSSRQWENKQWSQGIPKLRLQAAVRAKKEHFCRRAVAKFLGKHQTRLHSPSR